MIIGVSPNGVTNVLVGGAELQARTAFALQEFINHQIDEARKENVVELDVGSFIPYDLTIRALNEHPDLVLFWGTVCPECESLLLVSDERVTCATLCPKCDYLIDDFGEITRQYLFKDWISRFQLRNPEITIIQ